MFHKSSVPEHLTPLHYAVEIPGEAITNLLLDFGAEKCLFEQNKSGLEPITLISADTMRVFLDQKIVFKEGKKRRIFITLTH